MDAVNFFKERERLCNSMTNNQEFRCLHCPISSYNNDTKYSCIDFIRHYPERAVEIVEKWSSEHPVKTRGDVFREMFPNCSCPCPKDVSGGICIDYVKVIGKGCFDCKRAYWNAPAPDGFGKGGTE